MTRTRDMIFVRVCVEASVLLAALVWISCLTGCSRSAKWLDAIDRDKSLMQRAEDRANEGDIKSAISLYIDALADNPDTARAHLDVALLMHSHTEDYVGAIYHYRRYLELRPQAEKKEMIEDRIRLACHAFAATVFRPGDGPVALRAPKVEERPVADKVSKDDRYAEAQLAALEMENVVLREKIGELSARLLKARDLVSDQAGGRTSGDRRALVSETPPSLPPPVPSPAAGAASPRPEKVAEGRTYRVRKGDTLSSIAAKMYGDATRTERICDANRGTVSDPDRLRVGQSLIIP